MLTGILGGVGGCAGLFVAYGLIARRTSRESAGCASCELGAAGVCRTGSLLMRPGQAGDDARRTRSPSGAASRPPEAYPGALAEVMTMKPPGA